MSVWQWTKLDIGKVSVVRKEVDSAIELLSVTEDIVTRKNLIISFQTRINEIDSFLKHINDDERAALFENQNQRLRRACQSSETTTTHSSHRASIFENIPSPIQVTAAKTTTTIKIPSSTLNNVEEHKPFSSSIKSSSSPSPVKEHNFHAVHLKQVTNEILESTINSNENEVSNNNNASPSKISPYMTRRSSYSKPMTGYNIKSPEIIATTNSPKKNSSYAWLKDEHKHRITNLSIDNKFFNPCQEIGTYIVRKNSKINNEDDEDDDSFGPKTIEEKYIDVSIILTSDELNTFIARNRLLKRPDLIDFNSRTASTSVHYNSPYVSHNKVMEDHFRPKQQDKWLHATDIRPNISNHNIRM